MKKGIYIGYQSLTLNDSGGALCCKRNHDSLSELYDIETCIVANTACPSVSQKIRFYINRLFCCEPFDLSKVKRINFNEYDFVYIDSSRLGNIAKYLKNRNFKGKVVVFYHNFDYKFELGYYAKANFIKRWINVRVSLINERNALLYADSNIILNSRDVKELSKFYGKLKRYSIIPISLKDRYKLPNGISSPYKKGGKNFLFIGSYFFGNITGLDWFMQNVYPYVKINFTIVGQNMDKLKDNPIYDSVEIYSNVEDVRPFLQHADCMIMPIIGGSGMKVKLCEALMFGKNIIGTDEAFEGYSLDFNKVGACCNTKDEFIEAIMTFNKPVFNEYSREEYLNKYSYEATLNMFSSIIENL